MIVSLPIQRKDTDMTAQVGQLKTVSFVGLRDSRPILIVASSTQYSAVGQLLVFRLNGHLMITSTLFRTLIGPNIRLGCQGPRLKLRNSLPHGVHLLHDVDAFEASSAGPAVQGVMFQCCQSAWCTLPPACSAAASCRAALCRTHVAVGLVTVLWHHQDKTNSSHVSMETKLQEPGDTHILAQPNVIALALAL